MLGTKFGDDPLIFFTGLTGESSALNLFPAGTTTIRFGTLLLYQHLVVTTT